MALQPLKLRCQQGDVHLRVEQLLAGPGDLLLCGVLRQSFLVDQFRNAELSRTVGFHQTGMGNEGKAFPGFGMLDFVEENGGDQHRIHLMRRRFAKDHRLQFAQAMQG